MTSAMDNTARCATNGAPVATASLSSNTIAIGKEKTQFLDSGQYTMNGITRYERIFGTDYVSEGGRQSTQVGRSRQFL